MPAQGQAGSPFRIPDEDVPRPGADGQLSATGGKGDAQDLVPLTADSGPSLPGDRIDEVDHLVLAHGRDELAVRRIGHRVDHAAQALAPDQLILAHAPPEHPGRGRVLGLQGAAQLGPGLEQITTHEGGPSSLPARLGQLLARLPALRIRQVALVEQDQHDTRHQQRPQGHEDSPGAYPASLLALPGGDEVAHRLGHRGLAACQGPASVGQGSSGPDLLVAQPPPGPEPGGLLNLVQEGQLLPAAMDPAGEAAPGIDQRLVDQLHLGGVLVAQPGLAHRDEPGLDQPVHQALAGGG